MRHFKITLFKRGTNHTIYRNYLHAMLISSLSSLLFFDDVHKYASPCPDTKDGGNIIISSIVVDISSNRESC